MKSAVVKRRRTDPAGRKQINIVCPTCNKRHWIHVADTAQCPRRTSSSPFMIRLTKGNTK